MTELPLTYVSIAKQNLIDNIQSFRSFINGNQKIMAVIKANAYGHDAKLIVPIVSDYVDYFQVDDIEECIEIKDVANRPIMILGYVQKSDIEKAIQGGAILTVYDVDRLQYIDEIAGVNGKKAIIHIKVDALLGRQGILIDDVDDFIGELKKCSKVIVDAVYSHFANIEDTNDFSYAEQQIQVFDRAVEKFKNAGFADIKTHISATSGIMAYEKNLGQNNIVRLGMGMYGLWPSESLKEKYSGVINLKPALGWVSKIAQVKMMPAGSSIGYGLTCVISKPTKIAVVPVGYSDGFDRRFSNNGEVLINGTRCPVLGRIAMNMFVVDVSLSDNAKAEDEVVIIGIQGSNVVTVEEIANRIDTINYEIISRINPKIKRILVD